jgi:hypothetical protein
MSLDVYLVSDKCNFCGRDEHVVFEGNITHNLSEMAYAVGIRDQIWNPRCSGITIASLLIPWLDSGIEILKDEPDKYKKFNPENGWGSYDVFLKFLGKYLDACKKYPNAKVRVSR